MKESITDIGVKSNQYDLISHLSNRLDDKVGPTNLLFWTSPSQREGRSTSRTRATPSCLQLGNRVGRLRVLFYGER